MKGDEEQMKKAIKYVLGFTIITIMFSLMIAKALMMF